jgi:tripartite-type tricarboxylate transporter receptor subunit TctC
VIAGDAYGIGQTAAALFMREGAQAICIDHRAGVADAGTIRVRARRVSSSRRLPLIPEVPTIAEFGLPGFDVNSTNGVLVPANTPARHYQQTEPRYRAYPAAARDMRQSEGVEF